MKEGTTVPGQETGTRRAVAEPRQGSRWSRQLWTPAARLLEALTLLLVLGLWAAPADGAVQLRIPELLGVRVVLGRHVHLVELVKPLRATLERLLDLALRLNLLEDFGPAGFALGLHRATGNN